MYYKYRIMEQEQLIRLFSLNENEEKTGAVIELVRNKEFITDPEVFYESFLKAKHPKMLTRYSLEDFRKMLTFKLIGYNIGFALKPFMDKGYSEIVAVHNAELDVKGVGPALMDAAISLGGRYLDHYDGFLSGLYSHAGFIEYKRDAYDPMYDPDGLVRALYGRADVIYRHHKSVPNPLK